AAARVGRRGSAARDPDRERHPIDCTPRGGRRPGQQGHRDPPREARESRLRIRAREPPAARLPAADRGVPRRREVHLRIAARAAGGVGDRQARTGRPRRTAELGRHLDGERLARTRVGALARQAAPWAIAVAILWFLFDRVPIADAWSAAVRARLVEFVLVTSLAVTAWWLLESRALAYLFTRFNAPVTWKEARALRGLTYLATPVNWNLGTAAIILHLRRSKGIGAMQSTSTMLFYGLIDLMVLSTLALAGASARPASPEIARIQLAAAIADGFAIALLAALMTSRPRWRWLERLRAAGINQTHRKATARDVAVLVAVRTCYFLGFVLYFWLGTWAFNASVPLFLALAATPIILV